MLRYKTKTRPGLVALYDIRPGNGAGPFLQPRSPHGAKRRKRNCVAERWAYWFIKKLSSVWTRSNPKSNTLHDQERDLVRTSKLSRLTGVGYIWHLANPRAKGGRAIRPWPHPIWQCNLPPPPPASKEFCIGWRALGNSHYVSCSHAC